MSEETKTTTAAAPTPRPYLIDSPIHKVQSVEYDGDVAYVFRHDLKRLDASNYALLKTHEKETVRMTEKLPKGKQRARFNEMKADRNLYRALITGGGWRPGTLKALKDEALIPDAYKGLYTYNEKTDLHEPGWYELDVETCLTFTQEKMSAAIQRYLQAFAVYMPGGGIDFMFEKGGIMRIALHIGDKEDPAYKPCFEMRRPESTRRNNFREDFAYGIESVKGDMGKVETVINLDQGIGVFDEHFATVSTDPAYSQVLFTSKETKVEQAISNGDEPPNPGSVTDTNGGTGFGVEPYTDSRKQDLVALMNPMFKVEVAAAMVTAFSKTDRESPTR